MACAAALAVNYNNEAVEIACKSSKCVNIKRNSKTSINAHLFWLVWKLSTKRLSRFPLLSRDILLIVTLSQGALNWSSHGQLRAMFAFVNIDGTSPEIRKPDVTPAKQC